MMEAHQHETAVSPRTGIDPVCGMIVDLDHPQGGKVIYQGREIGFCSPSCKAKFQADPQRYPGNNKAPTVEEPPGEGWGGRRASEVEADRPGPCPRCGLALEPASPLPATRVEWTCPMHPQIVRSEPGFCPICGMALEPRTVTFEERNPELEDMSRRFWLSLLFTVPVFLLGMSEFLPGMPVQRALGRWM